MARQRIPAAVNFNDLEMEALYGALFEMTETYWGVNDARQGDGGSPPGCIVRARKALRSALAKSERA